MLRGSFSSRDDHDGAVVLVVDGDADAVELAEGLRAQDVRRRATACYVAVDTTTGRLSVSECAIAGTR